MNNPFSLKQIKNPILRMLVQKTSRLDILEEWYDDWLLNYKEQHGNVDAFIEYSLNRLDVRIDTIDEGSLSSIPKHGPFIAVANHPLGGLEGILLTQLLLSIRPDLKVLTNELLKQIPEFHDVFIGVDVLNKKKQRENVRGMREVSQHLANNGALLVFPAGTVSRLKLPSFTLADAPWNSLVSKLARKYNAPIMPMFVNNRNSLPFYLSGYIHKRFRTMLLPRAMLNKMGTDILVHIGALIPAADLQRLTDNNIATHYIRMCCEVLRCENQEDYIFDDDLNMASIKQNIDPNIITKHVESLEDCLIYSQGNFSLYCTPYPRLGPVVEQLAIERERTFREIEEGTGHELDSDHFDPHYKHLFLWDNDERKIAGGYRLGITNKILEERGIAGLYSHSLFDYNEKFLKKMGSTIELGRSFITPEYQRHPKALDLLWKGIGYFIAQNPQYHTLFGCVSISRQYSRLATTLLSKTFLSHYGVDSSIQRSVKARTPLNDSDTSWSETQISGLSAIPAVNKLVGRIDGGKSIPVLIRHYLALNGRFISFTVNKGFNESLDGLIMVDLRKTPDKYLQRYMGTEGLKKFKAQWGTEDVA